MATMTDSLNATFINCSSSFSEGINNSCVGYNYPDVTTSQPRVPRLKESARTYFIVGLVLAWTWTVLIISLNLAVLIIICGYKKRSRLYFYLLNLAIADLACGVLEALPHAIERTVGLEYFVTFWLAGNVFCKIQRTVGNTCIMTSNYLLAAMSIDRAYVICKPMLNIRRGNYLQKAIVVICWLFCFLASSPLLKYYETQFYNRRLPFSHKEQCTLNFGTDIQTIIKAYKTRLYLMFAFIFLAPLFIITGSYIMLVVSIYRRALKQTPSEKKQERSERDRLTMSRVFNKGVPKSKIKSIKLTIGIVLSFLVCWLASFIGNFMNILGRFNHPSLIILTTFYYWNSIANPILFFIYHRKKVRASASANWASTETSQMKHTVYTDTGAQGQGRTPNTSEFLISEGR